MKGPRQFSLAYLFLEIFWIAVTLALVRAAYWLHFRDRSFYGGWNSPASQAQFFFLVLAAIVSGGIAVGGLFQRMRLAAVIVVGGMLALAALSFVAMFLFGSAVQ